MIESLCTYACWCIFQPHPDVKPMAYANNFLRMFQWHKMTTLFVNFYCVEFIVSSPSIARFGKHVLPWSSDVRRDAAVHAQQWYIFFCQTLVRTSKHSWSLVDPSLLVKLLNHHFLSLHVLAKFLTTCLIHFLARNYCCHNLVGNWMGNN